MLGVRLARSLGRQRLGRALRLESLEERRLLDSEGMLEIARFDSDAELETMLVNEALDRYEHLFEQPAWSRGWWGCFACDFFPFGDVAFADGGFEAVPPPDHSDTNTQVAGVDEADYVETDGNFLYMLNEEELVIADAWQPSELHMLSRVDIDGRPIGQYLKGDRLTVISQTQQYYEPWLGQPWIGGPLIDVGFDFAPPLEWTPPRTKLTVLDVSDRANPSVVQAVELDGNYLSSRAIGDHVYLVTNTNFGLPEPELLCEDINPDENNNAPCVYESREAYLERVTGNVVELSLPHYSVLDASGQVTDDVMMMQSTDVYRPVSKSFPNLISVSVFDMADEAAGPTSSTGVPTTYTSTVYSSIDSLYLTNAAWGTEWSRGEISSILKLDIVDEGRGVELTATGQVPGRLLNQFSMDEFNDPSGAEYFRLATTTGFGQDSDNRVYVMQQSGDDLEITGKTARLAPGEQIFSVRFTPYTGYVVTFRQTDPLFTIDLTDPASPRVTGELHIPGFSNYLQPVSEDYLVGLGRDADVDTGRARELQVSLFDVSDDEQPLLADRFSFDVPDWAWSEAISDHHAVGYYPKHQVLAIPVSNGRGWVAVDRSGNGRADFQAYRPRTDLYVFQLHLPDDADAEKASINFLGTVQHDEDVRRSVRIEDFLYTISSDTVSVHEILDPTVEVNRIDFGNSHAGVKTFEADLNNPSVSTAIETPERSAPIVTRVMVAGSDWDYDLVNYLTDTDEGLPLEVVPSAGANEIKIQFSEDVYVGMQDLRIISHNGNPYSIREFSYDADTHTAIWTISPTIPADSIRVRLIRVQDLSHQRLDGDFDGTSGGVFSYRFGVLPGDADGDGRVDRADLASARALALSQIGDEAYQVSHDIDSNGVINQADLDLIESQSGTTLPGFIAPLPGDANGDGRFDSGDLVRVMQRGLYRTGEFATYGDGDWNRDGLFDEGDLIFAFKTGNYQRDIAASIDALFAAGSDDED